MAEESKPAGETKAQSAPSAAPASAPTTPAAPTSPGIMQLLVKGFMEWFNTKKAKASIVAFLLISIAMAGMFQYQHDTIKTVSLAEAIANSMGGGGGSSGKDPFAKYTDATSKADLSGQSTEGVASSPQKVTVGDLNTYQIVATITWTDEPNSARHTNQPDTFKIQVTSPDGRTTEGSAANAQGAAGTIQVVLSRDISKEVQENKVLKKKTQDPTWTGDWNINVTCTNAGDQTSNFGPSPIGLRTQADTGNSWKMSVEWTFKAEP
jgi:hypothetical protein